MLAYLEAVADVSDLSCRLSFLNGDSDSSRNSISSKASSIASASFVSSSALWKHSLSFASSTSSFHIESLFSKVVSFPNIQRQCLHELPTLLSAYVS